MLPELDVSYAHTDNPEYKVTPNLFFEENINKKSVYDKTEYVT
jgi:hypothetical protein